MFRLFNAEVFTKIPIDAPLKMNYAISNYGRLLSYNLTFDDGREIKGGLSDGYRTLHYRINEDGHRKNKYIFLYKLVAQYYIPKTSDEQTNVLHLDRRRNNDAVGNLKWATREEMLEHSRNSPFVIAAKSNKVKSEGRKLNSTQVIRLKKMLLDPERKTRLKIIARQFGISEMHLSRIKNGENWGHIIV